MWRRIEADGCTWEVSTTAATSELGTEHAAGAEEILEFRPLDGVRPPRRLVVAAGALAGMNDDALMMAYRQARPIGGDFYGRPGKRMGDVAGES